MFEMNLCSRQILLHQQYLLSSLMIFFVGFTPNLLFLIIFVLGLECSRWLSAVQCSSLLSVTCTLCNVSSHSTDTQQSVYTPLQLLTPTMFIDIVATSLNLLTPINDNPQQTDSLCQTTDCTQNMNVYSSLCLMSGARKYTSIHFWHHEDKIFWERGRDKIKLWYGLGIELSDRLH